MSDPVEDGKHSFFYSTRIGLEVQGTVYTLYRSQQHRERLAKTTSLCSRFSFQVRAERGRQRYLQHLVFRLENSALVPKIWN